MNSPENEKLKNNARLAENNSNNTKMKGIPSWKIKKIN